MERKIFKKMSCSQKVKLSLGKVSLTRLSSTEYLPLESRGKGTSFGQKSGFGKVGPSVRP